MKKRTKKAIKVKKVVAKLPKPPKPKKRPKYNQNSQIRSALRRTFSRSPIVQEVKKSTRSEHPQYNKDGSLAKKPAVRYKCAECCELFPGNAVAVDHISPVINIDDTFQDWNQFIDKLFCSPENLQVLCSYKLKDKHKFDGTPSCHHVKTQEERQLRKLANINKK